MQAVCRSNQIKAEPPADADFDADAMAAERQPSAFRTSEPRSCPIGSIHSSRWPSLHVQGKFFEAKCTEILPEEKAVVACFPEDAGFPGQSLHDGAWLALGTAFC